MRCLCMVVQKLIHLNLVNPGLNTVCRSVWNGVEWPGFSAGPGNCVPLWAQSLRLCAATKRRRWSGHWIPPSGDFHNFSSWSCGNQWNLLSWFGWLSTLRRGTWLPNAAIVINIEKRWCAPCLISDCVAPGSVHATSIAASRVEQALSEVASSLQSSAPKHGPLHPWMTLAQIWLHAGMNTNTHSTCATVKTETLTELWFH